MAHNFLLRWVAAATIAGLSTVLPSLPGRTADRITFNYPPFGDFSIGINDLETFAQTGEITPDFAFYAKRLPPAQLQQLREFLRQRFALSPVYVSQFTYAPLSEKFLDRMGEYVQTSARENGAKSLRSALILAAADKNNGLTPLNVLRQFPGQEVRLKLTEGLAVAGEFSQLLKRRDAMVALLNQIGNTESVQGTTDFATQPDLHEVGQFTWQIRQFDWIDQTRQRSVPGNLYLPQRTDTNSVPVIVFSHGVAEDRTTFAYLAEHLASHGFAVAVLEHTGGDAQRMQQYFSGLAPAPKATELLDRPRDVSFLLDELQRQSATDPLLKQLNLQQVGLMGHSLGGYTILALAGAKIDFDLVKKSCNPNRSLNLSVLLQCRANELKPKEYSLQDPRIKAVFAMNPLAYRIFGPQGLAPIQQPVFLLGGSDDMVTPAIPEQIYPFTWLQTPHKYLAIIEKGTHFSVQSMTAGKQTIPLPSSLIGPTPQIAQTYSKALSIAFFQAHLLDRPEFKAYLTAGYGRSMQQPIMPLHLVSASASQPIAQTLANYR